MKYGVQLFSLRKYLKTEEDYFSVFGKVKALGAEVVQLSCTAAAPVSFDVVKRASEQNGLPVCITHAPFPRIKDDIVRLAEEHALIGCREIGVGMMPSEYKENGFARLGEFIDALNGAAEKLKPYGMNVAYHNHWFEFDKVGEKTVFDRLIDETSVDVKFIPDTFWIKVGGEDPADFLKKRLDGRVDTLHLKDYKKTLGVPVFRALGKGTLDFHGIIDAAKSIGAENSVVEIDFSPNPWKSIETSMQFLKRYAENNQKTT